MSPTVRAAVRKLLAAAAARTDARFASLAQLIEDTASHQRREISARFERLEAQALTPAATDVPMESAAMLTRLQSAASTTATADHNAAIVALQALTHRRLGRKY